MKKFIYAFLLSLILTDVQAQKDADYYFKLGRKYMALKDYEQASKHFYKSMSIAEKENSDYANYYYFPMLMYFYRQGKDSQALKAAKLITEFIPESPFDAKKPKKATEEAFLRFFEKDYLKFDKSDYLFIRYYLQFKTGGEMDIEDAFNRMELAVKYHNPEKCEIPASEIYKLMTTIYTAYYSESPEADDLNQKAKERLCDIFKEKAESGKHEESQKIVEEKCR